MKASFLLLPFALLLPAMAARAKPSVPDNEVPVLLEPFQVIGHAVSNFPVDIQVYVSPKTKKVATIVITRVRENSEASELGLQAGDEIVSIDGEPVAGMDPKINRASQIGLLFLNRRPGDSLKLEIRMQRTRQAVLHAEVMLGV